MTTHVSMLVLVLWGLLASAGVPARMTTSLPRGRPPAVSARGRPPARGLRPANQLLLAVVVGLFLGCSAQDADPCSYAGDGECDVPQFCSSGDYADCGGAVQLASAQEHEEDEESDHWSESDIDCSDADTATQALNTLTSDEPQADGLVPCTEEEWNATASCCEDDETQDAFMVLWGYYERCDDADITTDMEHAIQMSEHQCGELLWDYDDDDYSTMPCSPSCSRAVPAGTGSGAGTTCADVDADGRLVYTDTGDIGTILGAQDGELSGESEIGRRLGELSDEDISDEDISANSENSALEFCSALVTLILPEGLVSIGSFPLDGCHNLVNVVVPDSVNTFGRGIFNGCHMLQTVEYCGEATVPEQYESLDGVISCNGQSKRPHSGRGTTCDDVGADGRLEFTGGASSDIPGNLWFHGCTRLKVLVVPSTVTDFGGNTLAIHGHGDSGHSLFVEYCGPTTLKTCEHISIARTTR
eukprot:SAG22_NODE_1271_length_4929_cov_4.159420_6_plen_473_part_00